MKKPVKKEHKGKKRITPKNHKKTRPEKLVHINNA